MDAKSIFFIVVFGLVGGYLVLTGISALRRTPAASHQPGARGIGRRRAVGSLVLGLVVLLALLVMYAPAGFAP